MKLLPNDICTSDVSVTPCVEIAPEFESDRAAYIFEDDVRTVGRE